MSESVTSSWQGLLVMYIPMTRRSSSASWIHLPASALNPIVTEHLMVFDWPCLIWENDFLIISA